ncbi:hypothetical protein HK102_000157 [Quaeritorhiza haematococci]|nr:hypothetical protein HK102_000157 [Quaeritorhiza haematococci]
MASSTESEGSEFMEGDGHWVYNRWPVSDGKEPVDATEAGGTGQPLSPGPSGMDFAKSETEPAVVFGSSAMAAPARQSTTDSLPNILQQQLQPADSFWSSQQVGDVPMVDTGDVPSPGSFAIPLSFLRKRRARMEGDGACGSDIDMDHRESISDLSTCGSEFDGSWAMPGPLKTPAEERFKRSVGVGGGGGSGWGAWNAPLALKTPADERHKMGQGGGGGGEKWNAPMVLKTPADEHFRKNDIPNPYFESAYYRPSPPVNATPELAAGPTSPSADRDSELLAASCPFTPSILSPRTPLTKELLNLQYAALMEKEEGEGQFPGAGGALRGDYGDAWMYDVVTPVESTAEQQQQQAEMVGKKPLQHEAVAGVKGTYATTTPPITLSSKPPPSIKKERMLRARAAAAKYSNQASAPGSSPSSPSPAPTSGKASGHVRFAVPGMHETSLTKSGVAPSIASILTYKTHSPAAASPPTPSLPVLPGSTASSSLPSPTIVMQSASSPSLLSPPHPPGVQLPPTPRSALRPRRGVLKQAGSPTANSGAVPLGGGTARNERLSAIAPPPIVTNVGVGTHAYGGLMGGTMNSITNAFLSSPSNITTTSVTSPPPAPSYPHKRTTAPLPNITPLSVASDTSGSSLSSPASTTSAASASEYPSASGRSHGEARGDTSPGSSGGFHLDLGASTLLLRRKKGKK